MKKKMIYKIIFIAVFSYIVLEIYYYKIEGCNIVLTVGNCSIEKPKVKIEVFIDDELIVSEDFDEINCFGGKSYKWNSMLGIKNIIVKIDGKEMYEGYFLLLGVRWIDISYNSDNKLLIFFNFYEKAIL